MKYRNILVSFCFITAVFLIIVISILYPIFKQKPEGKVIARINNYLLTEADFADELKGISIPVLPEDKMQAWKTEFLDDIIRKQLMLQEAQKLSLDKDKNFINMIERYWEQALLKSLIESKTRKGASTENFNVWLSGLRSNAKIIINEGNLKELNINNMRKK